jgi:hypothetical protein
MSEAVAGTQAGAATSSAAPSDTSASTATVADTSTTSTASSDAGSSGRGSGKGSGSRKSNAVTVGGGSPKDFFGDANDKSPAAERRSRRERNKADLAAKASGKPAQPAAEVAPSDASNDAAAQDTDAPEQGRRYTEAADDDAYSGDFDDETLQLANLHGMTAEEVEAYEPAQLKRFLTFLDKRDLSRTRQTTEAAETPAEGQKPVETKATETAAQQPDADADATADAAQAEFALEKYALALNPDDPLDPETAWQFAKLSDHYHGQLEKMLAHFNAKFSKFSTDFSESGKQIAFLGDWYRQTETERVTNEYDAAFASLPDHYKAEFGTGSIRDLDPNSKEFAARQAMAKEAERVLKNDVEAGRHRMSKQQLIKRAIAIRDFDKQYEQGRQDAAEFMGRRKRQGLSPPTQRRSEAVSAEQRAKVNLRQRMAKLGVPSGRGGKEVDQFFGS